MKFLAVERLIQVPDEVNVGSLAGRLQRILNEQCYDAGATTLAARVELVDEDGGRHHLAGRRPLVPLPRELRAN